jgi:hypothetical protein
MSAPKKVTAAAKHLSETECPAALTPNHLTRSDLGIFFCEDITPSS